MKVFFLARSNSCGNRHRRPFALDGARGLLLCGVLGVAALGLSGCGEGGASEAPSFQASPVLRQNMRITAEATGSVEPVRSVEVKSKASGEVLRLYVDIGDYVEPGTLLAEIDPRDVNNAYEQAVADLGVADAKMEISRAQLGRSQQLFEAGVITQQEFESQRLDFANSQASLVKSQFNKELRELQRQDVTIRAPAAGTILTRNVEEGNVIQSASGSVSGGTALFIMANLAEVQIRVLVDETDMGQIKPGLEASVQVEAYPGRIFPGVVEKMEPQAVNQQNVTMFPVIVRLDNTSGLLKPGMNAEVETLLVERPNVLVVPNNAVVLPQEVSPAAAVLGMNPEIELDMAVYSRIAQEAGLGSVQGVRGARGGAGGRGGAIPGRTPGAEAAPSGAAEPAAGRVPQPDGAQASGEVPDRRAMMADLRAKVESGEITQDSLDAVMASRRAQMGGEGGSPDAPVPVAAGAVQESNPALSGLLNTSASPRPAVAFVMLPDSTLELRQVLMGV
ncbi:MAG: efflux RND transporter periplasmic adaptor subunit, partial [Longimicrobiales bacterium]|nr:efflux RND transporter periplasmic adaptor subunit [Longimicrobiales bacterium]